MIYVPDLSYGCYEVLNKDTIRAYNINPNSSNLNSFNYRDYFINSHYIYSDGTLLVESGSSFNVSCISSDNLTNAYIYRNDIHQILFIAFILIFVCWFFVGSLCKTLFKGRKVF